MYIAIDSSNQLLYTGIISGREKDIDALYKEFEQIFSKNNVAGKYHWSKLSKKTRDKLKKPLIQALKNTSRVNLNIVQHRKPQKSEKKDWYVYYLPAKIAQRLERWLEKTRGHVDIIVDNDYNVVRGGDGTKNFIESLLRQLGVRLTGKEVTVRRERGILKATIKHANGRILNIFGSVANKGTKGLHLVDVYLGLYLSDKKAFEKLKNVYFLEI
ncbi:MAG: hypothetical protein ACLFUZ_00185 [Candidatus Micrarchaeia archaeon]